MGFGMLFEVWSCVAVVAFLVGRCMQVLIPFVLEALTLNATARNMGHL